ncbi:hypothetical protein D3C84_1213800 [compost metagenome]
MLNTEQFISAVFDVVFGESYAINFQSFDCVIDIRCIYITNGTGLTYNGCFHSTAVFLRDAVFCEFFAIQNKLFN